jgi:hypothetical protein
MLATCANACASAFRACRSWWGALTHAGANQVKTSLAETRNDLLAWRPALADHPGETAAAEKNHPIQALPQPVAQGLR